MLYQPACEARQTWMGSRLSLSEVDGGRELAACCKRKSWVAQALDRWLLARECLEALSTILRASHVPHRHKQASSQLKSRFATQSPRSWISSNQSSPVCSIGLQRRVPCYLEILPGCFCTLLKLSDLLRLGCTHPLHPLDHEAGELQLNQETLLLAAWAGCWFVPAVDFLIGVLILVEVQAHPSHRGLCFHSSGRSGLQK